MPTVESPAQPATDDDIWAVVRREFPDDYALQQVHVARRRLLRDAGPLGSPRLLARIAELARLARERLSSR
jgi:hypothetical protein